MLIHCPNCATSYDVEVASLRPNGRRVRCVRCRMVWHAELSHADKLIAAAEALGPGRRIAGPEAAAEPQGPVPSEYQPDPQPDALEELPVQEAAFAAPADDAYFDVPDNVDVAAASNDFPRMDSPPISPVDLDAVRVPGEFEPEHDTAAPVEPLGGLGSFARRPPRRAQGWSWGVSLSLLQWSTLALIIIDAIVIGWRADFVRLMPQTASFYATLGLPVNLRGLSFDSPTTSAEQHDGVPILVVQGNIINDTRKMVDVPHLRFAVRNTAHQEIYSWTAAPPRAVLPPGQAVAFHTRLASPPPDAHDVLVRFLNRYDIMNGAR